MVARVGTRALNQSNFFNIFRTLERVSSLQIQAATGKKGLDYRSMGETSEQLLNLESIFARGNKYIDNTTVIQSRIATMESSLNVMLDEANSLRQNLVNALNGDNYLELPMAQIGQSALDSFVSSMNKTDNDGRYIFAGSRTATPPVDLTSMVTPYDVNTANFEYYVGDNITHSIQADDNLSFNYGIQADETGFELLIRAAQGVANNPVNRDVLNGSLGLLEDAIDEITRLIASVGSTDATLENIKTRQTDYLLTVGNRISELENIDIPTVLAQLSGEEVQLEAAYTTVTRLTQLSLLNFL